jgi:hypothetical protein
MVAGLFHIRINSSEDNKDNGFYALMISGASIACLDDDEYMVPEKAVQKLNEKKIIYELVTKEEVANRKGVDKNATKT